MNKKEFKLRRDKLLNAIGKDGVAIIFSAKRYTDNQPYHQNSDFYYLTGFIEPCSIAALIPGRRNGAFILFNRKNDPATEIWDGPYVGQSRACKDFGADQSFDISEIDKILPRLLVNRNNIYTNLDFNGSFDPKIASWLTKSHKLINVGIILDELRLKKSLLEIKTIRKAVEVTTKAYLRALKKCHSNMYEFELEAEILHEFTSFGGCYPAFPTIVASGINACTLHYAKNNKKLIPGELVLVDAGATYNHYCADVSRTFPVNGKFTHKQHIFYEIILNSQQAVIEKIGPGIGWDQLQAIAERAITQGLIDTKILRGNVDQLLIKQKFKPFFMHKIGHWLGLEPHDVGSYRITNKWRTLEPGMVLTVEPGIYIRALNMGIRIEDNVLVTQRGCEVLTSEIPKNITTIEETMKQSSSIISP